MTVIRPALFACALGLLTACQLAPPESPGATAARGPVAIAPADAVPHRIDSERSRIQFIVRRGGSLARLGHNHVILARQVSGTLALAPEPARSTLSLRLPVEHFEVDPPAVRESLGEGFAPVSDSAVTGTRRNMLGDKVLDATSYPVVEVDTVSIRPLARGYEATLRITLRGQTRDLNVPVSLMPEPTGLALRSTFSVRQSDFGITPLAVLGGALRVEDAVEISLELIAQKPG